MSPNADANAQSKNKMSKTDTTSMNRTSSDYSVVSMDLSDSTSADGGGRNFFPSDWICDVFWIPNHFCVY
jgi:hypothetical protein